MGRRKKERPEAEFNPTDYDYMNDSFPLEGWIWEFMRRNEEVFWWSVDDQSLCAKHGPASDEVAKHWEKCPLEMPYRLFLISKGSVFLPWTEDDIFPWTPLGGVNKCDPVMVMNLKWGIHYFPVKHPATLLTPERNISYPLTVSGQKNAYYLKKYAEVKEVGQDEGVTLKYNIDPKCSPHPFDALKHEMGKDNVCMVLIDLSAPGDIKQHFEDAEKQLRHWKRTLKIKKPRQPKNIDGKEDGNTVNKKMFRFYIMIYDLVKHNNISPQDAGSILSKTYDIYNEDNIANYHYKRAVEYIDQHGFTKLL